MTDLDDFRAILALHAHCHFGRAAASLHISQPALTKRIRLLESRLGGALFERHSRGVTPTPAGNLMATHAQRILNDTRQMEQLTRQTLLGQSGDLRIGAGLTTLLAGLPQVLATFRRRHPHIRITVRDMSSADQLDALQRNEIDVGFLRIPPDAGDLAIEPLFEDQLKIAAGAALAAKKLKDLLASPFILMSRAVSPTFHDHVLATCHASGFTPNVVQEANQLLIILTLIQSGLGISLVPASCRTLRLPGVRILDTPLTGATWTVGLAWNQRSQSPVQLFLPYARSLRAD